MTTHFLTNSYADCWRWPLASWSFVGIPIGNHRGAFGKVRRHDTHTGVDLYCVHDTEVFAVEDGEVISVENFTGPSADAGREGPSPWWNDTKAVLVKGKSGVVLYGELYPHLEAGDKIMAGTRVGFSRTVIKKDKGLPMCMLHLELYKPQTTESVWWPLEQNQPSNLLDPTPQLVKAYSNLRLPNTKSQAVEDAYKRGLKKGYDEGWDEACYGSDWAFR